MKKLITVCERLLCGDLNALLHIAVIFTTHRKRNVVIFYISFSFMKVFIKKLLPIFSNCRLLVYSCFFTLSLDYTVISILCNL